MFSALGSGPRLDDIHAVHEHTRHAEGLTLLPDVRLRVPERRSGSARVVHADGPQVVLDAINDGQLVEGSQVHALVKGAVIGSAIAEEGDRDLRRTGRFPRFSDSKTAVSRGSASGGTSAAARATKAAIVRPPGCPRCRVDPPASHLVCLLVLQHVPEVAGAECGAGGHLGAHAARQRPKVEARACRDTDRPLNRRTGMPSPMNA